MQRNLVIRGNSTQKVLCGRDHMVDSFVSLFDPLSTAIFFFCAVLIVLLRHTRVSFETRS